MPLRDMRMQRDAKARKSARKSATIKGAFCSASDLPDMLEPEPVPELEPPLKDPEDSVNDDATRARALLCGDDFVSTTMFLPNRLADRAQVEVQLGLPEDGAVEAARLISLCDRLGTPIAHSYQRIVYGDHGPYVEISPEGLAAASQRKWTQEGEPGAYYQAHRTPGGCKVYEQTQSVAGKPNPPMGRRSVQNNRPEGYADYRPGFFCALAPVIFVLSP